MLKKPQQRKTRVADNRRGAKAVIARAPVVGWRTSDEDEIALRRWRGSTDVLDVVAIDVADAFFGTFRVRSGGGSDYEVEIRSLDALTNSCGCIDHRVNGLGTCKHIEGVLVALRKGRSRAFKAAAQVGSGRVEIFLDPRVRAPVVTWPSLSQDASAAVAARDWLAPWLLNDGTLTSDPDQIAALHAAWPKAPATVACALRLSRHFGPWLERARQKTQRAASRAAFEADVIAGRDTLDVLSHPLLAYQQIGAMHLAFGKRALLDDDMGLGKTIQAIAACELLGRREGVERVLVVCPASLKTEWEEQIARFSARATRLVFGPRAQRLAAYREPAVFTIVNYEQVLSDADDINAILKPDIVVLDEAQRIKNWQTKTARRVKSVRAPYAFVLTGTPIENRIDELYPIVQYLDPEILGPLFRFNRDFYDLDERGRPVDYKNLADLRERVRPVMLRRRKADVEKELPGRTVKTYFVRMAEEQTSRYEDYRMPAAQLIAQAQRRPLRQQEFDRLQQLLACMRMVCDTPAILDPTCRVCPKLEELEGILEDLLANPSRKVIVFSEWERMLAMVRELAGEMGIETAWHTGSVPQDRRRAEINRFKHDPACRLFLSTDSGSVGLNLQVASAVINIDLPWNPAKHEQRIARAWRKNQTRSVAVINLVTEVSIEHSILHLLGQKQALADGIIDGEGDLGALKMPSGRGACIERMQAMMDMPSRAPRVISPEKAFVTELVQRHGENVVLIEGRRDGEGRSAFLAVLDIDGASLTAERERPVDVSVEFVDPAEWQTLKRLAANGFLRFAQNATTLHRSAALTFDDVVTDTDKGRAAEAMIEADRAMQIGSLLVSNGFPEEAAQHLLRALRNMATALTAAHGDSVAEPGSDDNILRLVDRAILPAEALTILDAAASSVPSQKPRKVQSLMAAVSHVMAAIKRNEPNIQMAAA